MNEIEELEVIIGNDGRLSVEVHGVKGPRCRELTLELEAALGDVVLERRHTNEYLQQPALDRLRGRQRQRDD